MNILVASVSQLYQGDLDAGRLAVERLGDLGANVDVEDLSYGAVAVAQRLEELAPDALVLVGAVARGRPPGTVERREAEPVGAGDAQGSIADAVTGYIDLDLVVDVSAALGALPSPTVVIEVEPETTEPSERLSPTVERAIAELVRLVEAEVQALSRKPSP